MTENLRKLEDSLLNVDPKDLSWDRRVKLYEQVSHNRIQFLEYLRKVDFQVSVEKLLKDSSAIALFQYFLSLPPDKLEALKGQLALEQK